MEKFSLISTCFNYEKYVGYAIDSFISQTYENKELVIVDDCSTDNSWSIISEYAKKYNNIIAIRNKERQFCSSSNRIALNNATGDFCGVLDGDDVLVSTAMSEVAEKYNKFPHISYIYTQFIWYDGKLEKGRTGISSLPKTGKSLVDMFLMNSHCFSHWRTMRTKCRDKIDIFPEGLKYGVDKHMGFMLEEVGLGGFYNKVLYKYRFHKNNMTHYAIKSQKPDTIILAKKIQKRLDRKVYPIVKI